ncbi:MASE1 domain-containing protein [Herbaspirillum camelliae]|uniref:MASE1 domain-containing protein n=1 Tax=Herbaspirillum camelliae TaxID=1892903 RepID=UPI000949F2FE|nr:MASE1 domain-containing protein [Herbaspirillum camelliae]
MASGNNINRSAAHWHGWGQYVAIAAAYEAVYEITLYLSSPQFLLTTGLRLACMLLLPMRFWPALAVGECVPLLEHAVFCAPKFGIPWAILASVPTVALWWPVLKRVRQQGSLYDATGCPRIPLMLIATFFAAIITAGITTLTWVAALLHRPGKWPDHDPYQVFFSCLLGAYLGALTLTPVILALRERCGTLSLRPGLLWRSRLLRDVVWWVLPTLTALVWFVLSTENDVVRQVARLALLWPVLGLAWCHGWHGTALGGMMASFALAATAQGLLDPGMLRIQAVLAVVLSGTLIAGARQRWITSVRRLERS